MHETQDIPSTYSSHKTFYKKRLLIGLVRFVDHAGMIPWCEETACHEHKAAHGIPIKPASFGRSPEWLRYGIAGGKPADTWKTYINTTVRQCCYSALLACVLEAMVGLQACYWVNFDGALRGQILTMCQNCLKPKKKQVNSK